MKNIEWVKKEIENMPHTRFKREGMEDYILISKSDVLEYLDQLDEPEVLSQEWIDEHVDYVDVRGGTQAFIHVEYLQNLIVPKEPLGNSQELEKVQIPQFVVDWIEEVKPDNSLRVAFEYIAQQKKDNHDDELAFWVEEGNSETFARAWLDGYEVEEEQKYVVELPNPNNQMGRHKNVFLNKKDGKVFIDSASLFVNDITKYGQFALTEEEIKKDFEWAWKFAKPVEELEE